MQDLAQTFIPETMASFAASHADRRFQNLLSEADWARLPPAVRRRFTKKIGASEKVVYVGEVLAIRYSPLGWLLANLLRVLGAPLPLSRLKNAASVVAVTEDRDGGGQIWTRIFARKTGFPHVIQSAKRFAGPTGLEEAIGFGIVMALRSAVEGTALAFHSAGYYLEVGRRRLAIPGALAPGLLTVTHEELTEESFLFTLHLEHPLFGELVHQEAAYREERQP